MDTHLVTAQHLYQVPLWEQLQGPSFPVMGGGRAALPKGGLCSVLTHPHHVLLKNGNKNQLSPQESDG